MQVLGKCLIFACSESDAIFIWMILEREEALARVNAAKKLKREIAAELEKEMKTQYEKETGKKANYFFVL